MILAVDIGNTNIVTACIKNDNIEFVFRIATDTSKTEYQYAVEINSIFQLYKIDIFSVEGIIISSVVPSLLYTLKSAMLKLTDIEPIVLNHSLNLDIELDVENAQSVGMDRIVNCIAASKYYKPPVIVFDMGTSTTISVVDRFGKYIGGCIIPGVKTSLDSLSAKAAQLPYIALDNPKHVIGKDTVECMQSGILYGTSSMVDGMIDKIEAEMHEKAISIATGGISKFIIPNCKKKIEFDEHLLLKGLNIVFRDYMKN